MEQKIMPITRKPWTDHTHERENYCLFVNLKVAAVMSQKFTFIFFCFDNKIKGLKIMSRDDVDSLTVFLVSISPTFKTRLFRTKVLRKNFFYLHFKFELFWHKNIVSNALIKVVKIDYLLSFYSPTFWMNIIVFNKLS